MISCKYCILGAGPAGLSAALELTRLGEIDITIVDKNNKVGGLSRTEDFAEALFDLGPHRFFTKNDEIDKLWHETLGNDFRPVRRQTRILYDNKLFDYPLNVKNALTNFGIIEAAHSAVSFAHAKARRSRTVPDTFEDWVIERFGGKLYRTFFKTYTEKVWGMPCREISADWASQRIKGLDLAAVLKKALPMPRSETPKTLVDEFDFPRLGAGMMYQRFAEQAEARGASILLGATVVAIDRMDERIKGIEIQGVDGERTRIEAEHYLSSVPITHLVKMTKPVFDDDVLQACDELYFRDHISVNIVVEGPSAFPDQWIYVHSQDITAARFADFRNFSTDMTHGRDVHLLGMEYFTFKGDNLWTRSDAELAELAIDELESIGFLRRARVTASTVIRETECYPVYYIGYDRQFAPVKNAVDSLTNLTPIGRGGMYKYNNMDHSIFTGLLAARNLAGATGRPYDLWRVNIDSEYHESARRD